MTASNLGPNLGPGDLAPQPDGTFALDNAAWQAVRRYTLTALSMPTNPDEMRRLLDVPNSTDIGPVADALPVLAQVNTNAVRWNGLIWPEVVRVAALIRDYAARQATTLQQLHMMSTSPTLNPLRRDVFLRLLTDNIGAASDAASKASAALSKVQDFVPALKVDAQHVSTLHSVLGGRLQQADVSLRNVRETVMRLYSDLQQRQADYEHAKIVAETTPTYAWIFPFGTIAAAVVAGKYGSDAVDLSGQIKGVQTQLAGLDADVRRDQATLLMMHSLSDSTAALAQAINQALPTLQHIEGAWQSLADRLVAVQSAVDPKAEINDVLTRLGIEVAVAEWGALDKLAAAFLAHAMAPHFEAASPLPATAALRNILQVAANTLDLRMVAVA